MTLTDIKRPQAIAVVSKYLVYQVSSGVSVSGGTLCPMTHSRPRGGDASPGCRAPGQRKVEGDSIRLARY